ncbi:hypothetical protein F5883DRAFT_523352 [Diaporthe sp. PMI_573]|nr:hypothetical protein F5883DRAFT_523352 [Diaporthaceae sp. PMI_573]
MADMMGLFPLITEEDFNFAMGFTNESPLEARLKAARESVNRQYRQLRQADGQYYANEGSDSDRVFHLFPKLPAELQLMVWKHAVDGLPVPKIQAFDFDLAYDPNASPAHRSGNGVIACFKPKYTRALAAHRGLLTACIDSRKAFLDSGDYHMLPLTYLVSPDGKEVTKKQKKESESFEDYVKKSNETFDKMCDVSRRKSEEGEKTTPKIKKNDTTKDSSQANKTFARVVLPVNFTETRFLIDKVAETFAYKSIHPAPPSAGRVFTEAAGLEFMHSIKKLAFSMTKDSLNSDVIFCDWFATDPNQNRRGIRPSPYTLGALEELSYVSAKAFKRQCCIGHGPIWNVVRCLKIRDFQHGLKGTGHWRVRDLYRVHLTLITRWRQFDQAFNLRWAKAMRQTCTCRR